MPVNRYYACDVVAGRPILETLVSALGEPTARVVSIFDVAAGQALCSVRATNHAALAVDLRVTLLFDGTLDTPWGLLGTSGDRKALSYAMIARGFDKGLFLDPDRLYSEIIRACGQRFEPGFSELNFSA